MNVTAIISLNNATVPAVPEEAIVSMAGQDFIFMLKESVEAKHEANEPATGGTHAHGKEYVFERVPVVKATTDVGYAEVNLLKEIRPNTKFVTKRAFFVQAKMTNT